MFFTFLFFSGWRLGSASSFRRKERKKRRFSASRETSSSGFFFLLLLPSLLPVDFGFEGDDMFIARAPKVLWPEMLAVFINIPLELELWSLCEWTENGAKYCDSQTSSKSHRNDVNCEDNSRAWPVAVIVCASHASLRPPSGDKLIICWYRLFACFRFQLWFLSIKAIGNHSERGATSAEPLKFDNVCRVLRYSAMPKPI